MRNRKATQFSLLGLLALLWGSSYLYIEIGLETLAPVTLVVFRNSIAATCLLLVICWRGIVLPRQIGYWGAVFLQSVLIGTGPVLLLVWGEKIVGSETAAILSSSSPVFVVFILTLVSRHEAVGLHKFIGGIFGLVGIVLVIGPGRLLSLGQELLAEVALLLSALLYGYGSVYGRKFNDLPPIVTVAGMLICSLGVLVPVSLFWEQPWTLSPSLPSMAAVTALGLAATAGGFVLYFHLLKSLGSLTTASECYLRMLVSVLLSALFLNDKVTALFGPGLVMILLGTVLINLPRHRLPTVLQPTRSSSRPLPDLPGD